jgi:hypothetical protein
MTDQRESQSYATLVARMAVPPSRSSGRRDFFVPAIWGRCDGTPGNPGVETIPSEDGPEKTACLGCPACRADGVRARIARTGDVTLGAGAPADVEF